MSNSNVVEIVNFSLASGFTEQDFMLSNEKMDLFLKEQAGLLYRSLCKREDDSYVDIVYWENMDKAKMAQQAFYSSPLCQTFAQCIEKESVKLEHVEVLASQGCDS
jgi:hypothetical protein